MLSTNLSIRVVSLKDTLFPCAFDYFDFSIGSVLFLLYNGK